MGFTSQSSWSYSHMEDDMDEIQDGSAEILQAFAQTLEETFPGYGFALIVFEFDAPALSNYISNAQRPDMIKALRETANRLEKRMGDQPHQKSHPSEN